MVFVVLVDNVGIVYCLLHFQPIKRGIVTLIKEKGVAGCYNTPESKYESVIIVMLPIRFSGGLH